MNSQDGAPFVLSQKGFLDAVVRLGELDPRLGTITARHGPPPFWNRPPGFPTLVHIILEQQVSLASARAAFDKLGELIDPITPAGFASLSDAVLRTAGFSRQKTRYCRLLAEAILSGKTDLDALENMPDEDAYQHLLTLTGIGPWTAQIYLLMALRRPDIWPGGDLALQAAVQQIFNLESRPRAEDTHEYAANWAPLRSVAARMLWHLYLSS